MFSTLDLFASAMTQNLLPEQIRALDYLRRKGSQAPANELRGKLSQAFRDFEALLLSVAPAERLVSPAPGKWSPQEILDHLVESHRPAVEPLRQLLQGESTEAVAIPAGLQSPDPHGRSWDALAAELAAIHAGVEALVAEASDTIPLEAKAVVEMVVKVSAEESQEPRPVHWLAPVDWKQYVQALRVHTLEHRTQMERALAAVRL